MSKPKTLIRKLATILAITGTSLISFAQRSDGDFHIALPEHNGQLRWTAPGFHAIEWSAKPNGGELGVRAENRERHVSFLAFIFLVPQQAPLTSAKCRDGALDPDKRTNPTLTILHSSEVIGKDGLRTELVGYSVQKKDGKIAYSERGFIAAGDVCGDIEFYADASLPEEAGIKQILSTFTLEQTYVPQFPDVFTYSQILYDHRAYAAAAPLFELALNKLHAHPEGDVKTMTRVLTDQAGMAYAMAGNNGKARAIFEAGIASDPDYPLYYYNLACADAADKDLSAAHDHLQKAFARKGNVLRGETMPDPTKDDSFLPYQSNKEFWKFLETLSPKP